MCFWTPDTPNKENPNVSWSASPVLSLNGLKICKFASPSHLVLISFWMLTVPWIFDPISFYRRASRFVVFQTKVAHLCFCLVRIKMPFAHIYIYIYTHIQIEAVCRGRKRHINIWHINNLSVTPPVTDPPGRVPDPPGWVPGRKCLCSLGAAHST